MTAALTTADHREPKHVAAARERIELAQRDVETVEKYHDAVSALEAKKISQRPDAEAALDLAVRDLAKITAEFEKAKALLEHAGPEYVNIRARYEACWGHAKSVCVDVPMRVTPLSFRVNYR